MSTVELPETIAAFVAAVNRGDQNAVLDAFSENGFVDDWGTVYRGREAIAAWSLREFAGAQGTLTPESVSEGADGVTLIGDWRSNFANGLSRFTFALDGDLFASMTIREG